MASDYAASSPLPAEVQVAARRVRRIQPSEGLVPIDFGELWSFRELLWIFMWRDLKARYKQTFLGPLWAILRPIASTVVFTVVFAKLAHVKTPGPYALFVLPAVMIWNYFVSGLTGVSGSLASNGGLISKTYFPRLYAPISAVTAPLMDFVLSLIVLFGLLAYYGQVPSWHIVFLPLFLLLCMLAALAFGLWLSGITVRYRDVPFALPFVISMWMYASAVVIPVEQVPKRWQWVLSLNPMTAVVEGTRWSVGGGAHLRLGMLAIGCGIALALIVPGLYFFRRTERTIVDNL